MTELISNTDDFFVIDETPELKLGGLWEQIFLLDKRNNKEYFMGEFDGVSDIGIIDKKNEWAVAANNKVIIWKRGEIHVVDRPELKNVESLELKGNNLIQLSVDTQNLNGNKAKWQLNVDTLGIVKSE